MELGQVDEGEAIRQIVKRGGLWAFCEEFYDTVEPGGGFKNNWHIGCLSKHYEAVSRGEIKRLVVNIPPGCMKSIMTSVMWPAWHWTFEPSHKWMFGSNDLNLVLRDARRMLNLIKSDEFRSAWPEFDLGANVHAMGNFWNAHGGRRISVSVGGKGIGEHCHTQVCDDPIKAKEFTTNDLERASEWWSSTMGLRQADPKNFRRVIIMQRLHEMDLAGEMLEEQGWEHLCLPMRYVPSCVWDMGSSLNRNQEADPRTEPGELLWKNRIDEEAAEAREQSLKSPSKISAQEQQNPTPAKGGFVERDWLRHTWTDDMFKPQFIQWVQSWDLGFKGADGKAKKGKPRSRVHGALWFILRRQAEGDLICLFDEIGPEHWNYAQTKRAFREVQTKPYWKNARIKLVEEKANGSALISELRDEFQITPVNPKDSKEVRLVRHQDTLETGMVLFPPKSKLVTVEEFKEELVKFPRGQYDDRVDTTTQLLDYATSKAARNAAAWRNVANNMRRTRR